MFTRAIIFAIIGILVWLIWMQLKKSLLSDLGTRGEKRLRRGRPKEAADLELDPKTGKYRLSRTERKDQAD